MFVTLAAVASSVALGCAAAVRSWPVLRLRLRLGVLSGNCSDLAVLIRGASFISLSANVTLRAHR